MPCSNSHFGAFDIGQHIKISEISAVVSWTDNFHYLKYKCLYQISRVYLLLS